MCGFSVQMSVVSSWLEAWCGLVVVVAGLLRGCRILDRILCLVSITWFCPLRGMMWRRYWSPVPFHLPLGGFWLNIAGVSWSDDAGP